MLPKKHARGSKKTKKKKGIEDFIQSQEEEKIIYYIYSKHRYSIRVILKAGPFF